jgi:aquaporin Z
MMTRKLLTECIGTFFLVLTIGMTVTAGLPAAPVAVGGVLAALVYMGGHVSGAHYNPAVTLAVLLRGRIRAGEAAAYAAAQLGGAVLAAGAVSAVTGLAFVAQPAISASPLAVLLVEGLFTFILALVVLNVATTRTEEGNAYFGIAIGFTVMAAAFAGSAVSGGVFNPAVGVGPALVSAALGEGGLGSAWYYVVGPFAGAALAALAFRVQNPEELAAPAAPRVALPFRGIAANRTTPAETVRER